MTLNDLKWIFRVKYCFALVRLRLCNLRKLIACKLIKIYKYTVSVTNLRQGSSFWQYKVCADIRWDSLERKR